jgi:hypothetical protein
VGKCAGANEGLIASGELDQPLQVTKRPCRSVVGRLLDTLDNDPSGVSAMQHSRSVSSEWMGDAFADSELAVSAPPASLAS